MKTLFNFNKTMLFAALFLLAAVSQAQTVTYLWSNGATTPNIVVNPQQTTTYYLTMTQNGVQYFDSLVVTVTPPPVVSINGNSTICFGFSTTLQASPGVSYLWSNGETTASITVSPSINTSYSVQVTDASGCTGTAEMNVLVNQPSTANQTTFACNSYTWNGNTYTQSGTYYWTGENAAGCDSLVTLNLTITTQPQQPTLACWQTAVFNAATCSWDISGTPAPSIVTHASACGSYTWEANGQSYNTSGLYNYSSNCQDYQLNLTINEPNAVTVNTSITEGEVYNFNGLSIAENGTYEMVLVNAAGCDSTVTLNLTVTPVEEPIDCSIISSSTNVCSGDSVSLGIGGQANPGVNAVSAPIENILYSGTGAWYYTPGNDIIGNYSWSYGTPGMFIFGDSTQRYGSIEAEVRATGGINAAGIAMSVQRSNGGPHPFNGPNGGYFLAIDGSSNLVLYQGNNNLYWMGYQAIVLAIANVPGINFNQFQKLKLEVLPGGVVKGYLNGIQLLSYLIPGGEPQSGRFALITANASYEYRGVSSSYYLNSILWSTGATTPIIHVQPAETTTYSVTVYQNGQTCTDNITIDVLANLVYYPDNDGDGYGNAELPVTSCDGAPSGYVLNNSDCNDADPLQFNGSACNDNDPCTTGDIILTDCSCAGTFADSDNDSTCDSQDPCYGKPLAVNYPEDIILSCGDNIPTFDPGFYMEDGSAVTVTFTESQSTDGCSSTSTQIWIATNNCNESTMVTRQISFEDTTAPVFSSYPGDWVLACDVQVPAPPQLTATDNCDENITITYSENTLGTVANGSNLFTPVRPADNTCNYPYDWAMALFSLPSQYRWYQLDPNTPATMVDNGDNTLTLSGKVFNVVLPDGGFYFNVTYARGVNWVDWSNDGLPSGYKADCAGEDDNHPSWMYYIMQPSANAELAGWGRFAGSSIHLWHAPSNEYFGFQVGDGANNYNGDDGAGGWFLYGGVGDTFLDNGQPIMGGSFTQQGIGDFAFRKEDCPSYSIIRTWTATDCSGNQSTYEQQISFGDQPSCNGIPVGTSCNDNNPCTVNDVILADCSCAGTFADADNDGICNANDLCQGAEPGSACNDNNPCTTNDVVLADCVCAGTFVGDSDSDGTCDASDLCAGAEPGIGCNDNNPCTVNDIILADCSCAGTFADADNDGTCDANDLCNGPEPGTACDDNDPCTINDIILADCSCAGTFADADNDGTCDALDVCPITASASTICAGDTVTLSVNNSQASPIQNAFDPLVYNNFIFSAINPATSKRTIWKKTTPNSAYTPLFNDNYNRVQVTLGNGNNRIAYVRYKSNLPNGASDSAWVCTSNLDGFNETIHFIVPNFTRDDVTSLDWSNDNSKLVLTLFNDLYPTITRDGDVFTYTFSNNTLSNLTNDFTFYNNMAVVQKGTNNIIYNRNETEWVAFNVLLYQMNINGGTPTQIVGRGNYSYPNSNIFPTDANQSYIYYRRGGNQGGTRYLYRKNLLTNAENIMVNTAGRSGIEIEDNYIAWLDFSNDIHLWNMQQQELASFDINSIANFDLDAYYQNTANDNNFDLQWLGKWPTNTTQIIWSTGESAPVISVNPSVTSTYSVTIIEADQSCSADITIEVNQPSSSTIDAAITAGETYNFNGQPVTTSGTYEVVLVNAAGCDSTVTLSLTVNPPLNCEITAPVTSICSGESVELSMNNVVNSDVCASNQLPSSLQNGLVTYLPFCGNANDVSGNAHNGVVNGAALTADRFGEFNSAYSFQSSTIKVVPFQVLGQAFSFNFWIKPTNTLNASTSRQDLFALSFGACQFYYIQGRLRLELYNQNHQLSQYDYITDIASSAWTNLGLSIQAGGSVELYFNGVKVILGSAPAVLQSVIAVAPGLQTVAGSLLLGHEVSYVGPFYYAGVMDDFFVYNRSLSTGEQQQLYSAPGQALQPLPNGSTIQWSTGATTPSIVATPTTTTTYVATVNSGTQTCLDSITVVVLPNETYYSDADGDGFGNFEMPLTSCEGSPEGYTLDNTDCNDSNAAVFINASCDDNNPCTVNDIILADCSCAGTFADADNDGTCDANDLCNGPEPGTACDDSDPCTVGDIILADCTCDGTFADADNDGTCDANDLCEGPEPGTACDDTDPCTVSDIILADCTCAGTFADADNDGTCDSNDLCTGPEPGTACDDYNTCTINDIILADCACAGIFADNDNDGTCDANDLCAGAEPGSSCDDGDACTVNDIILADCSCAGTFADADNDGTCDANDLCNGPEPGTACDDTDPCTEGDVILADCSCAGTFADADNDGTCDANDLCNGPEPGTACDDTDPCTVSDIILADCSCAGTFADADNDGTCDANDLCNGPEPGTACDDTDPCTVSDIILADCSCTGTFADADNDGTCDANDLCNGPEPGTACDDNNSCTVGDIILADCSCAGTFADADNDGTCDANDLCNGPEPGTACDDTDPCTVSDIIQADCTCAGTFADADNDGTCDASDLCEGAEPGSPCNDNDPCTINDKVTDDCTCEGTLSLPAAGEETAFACSSYSWNGSVYTASGDYEYYTPAASGCDSLTVLHLTVGQPTFENNTVSACNSYLWNGSTYPQSGTYTYVTTNASGCPNTATLDLTILPTVVPTFNAAGPYCQGANIPALPTTSTNGISGGWSPAMNNQSTTTYTFTPNGNQCATTTALTVTINTPSTAPTAAVASASSVNAGTSVTLSVSGGSLGTGAQWKWYRGSCGGTFLGTGASITVAPSATETYFVRAEGTCNTTTCTTVTVNVLSAQCGPEVVSASSTRICSGSSTTLSVLGTLYPGAIWRWRRNSCTGTIVGTGASLSVSPTANTTYYVRAEGGTCGVTVCLEITIIVDKLPSTPSVISGPTSGLCNAQNVTYSVTPVSTVQQYNWTVPPGITIVSGQGTASVTVNVSNFINTNPTNGNPAICVTAQNACGNSPIRCLSLTTFPNTPASISGPAQPCINTVNTYSCPAVYGASSYTWLVPTGWVIQSGQGTSSITVLCNGTGGSVRVRTANACGTSGLKSMTVAPKACSTSAMPMQLELWPNPTSDRVFFAHGEAQPEHMQIYDMLGRDIYNGGWLPEFDVSGLASGIYFVRATSGGESVMKRMEVVR